MKIIHSLLGIYIAYRDLGKVQMQKIQIFTILHFILQSEIFCLWSNRVFRVVVRHNTAGHVPPSPQPQTCKPPPPHPGHLPQGHIPPGHLTLRHTLPRTHTPWDI